MSQIFLSSLSVTEASAATGIHRSFNYQGRLLSSLGSNVLDGTYAIKFSLYSAASGGTPIYTASGTVGVPEAINVTVTSGLFSVLIGDTSFQGQNAIDVDFNQDSLYLGVTVAADAEMAPRKRLSAVPYAFNSETLQGNYASSSAISGSSGAGTLFYLNQASSTSATATRTVLLIETAGTSDAFDYLLRAKQASGADVFSISRQGNVTTTGNLSIGDAASDFLTVNARVGSDLIPSQDLVYFLGSSSLRWAGLSAGTVTSTNVIATTVSSTTGTFTNTSFVNGTSTSWFGASTVSTTQLFVNGTPIGGGVPATTATLQTITSNGASTTDQLYLFNGFIASSSTVTSTFSVLGQTSLQLLSFTSATASAVTTTNLYVSGSASTSQLFVNGQTVCLANGTNCPASSSTDLNWTYDLAGDFVRDATPTTDVVLGSSATSTGAPVYFDLSGGTNGTSTVYFGHATNTNVIIGGTSNTVSYMNSGFVLDGNDLFVAGNIGSASSVYTNGTFVAGTGTTLYGSSYIANTNATLTLSSVQALLVNATSTFRDAITAQSRVDAPYLNRRAWVPLLYQTINGASTTVAVGVAPGNLAFDGSYMWVANRTSNNISIVDILTNQVVATTTLPGSPRGIAFDGSSMWVGYATGSVVSRIDILSRTITATVAVGTGATQGIAFDGTSIWAVNNGGSNVSKISLATNSVVATTTVGSVPNGIAFDGSNVWVVNTGSGSVSKIDISTNAVVATTVIGASAATNPIRIAFDGAYMWVGNSVGNSLSKIDIRTNTVVATTTNVTDAREVVYDGKNIWAINLSANTVTKVDASTNAVISTSTVGSSPLGMAFDGTHLWVSNFGAGTVSKIEIGGGFDGDYLFGVRLLPTSHNLFDIGSASTSWRDIYASGTVRVATNVVVNGSSVCLASGTNCPTGADQNWTYSLAGDFVRNATATTDIVLGSSATSTGAPAYFDLSGGMAGTSTFYFGHATNANILVGTTTYGGGLNSLFVLNGNDLVVQGQIGSIGGLHSNALNIEGSTVLNGQTTLTVPDNTSAAFNVAQSSNDYIAVNTNNSTENISFGNFSTNPYYAFQGSGTVYFGADIRFSSISTIATTQYQMGVSAAGSNPLFIQTPNGPIAGANGKFFNINTGTGGAATALLAGGSGGGFLVTGGAGGVGSAAQVGGNGASITLTAGAGGATGGAGAGTSGTINLIGNVGIGTTSPTTSLEVIGTVSSTAMVVGGISVCLANGTNCPSSSGSITSSTWQFNVTSNIAYLTTSTQDVLMGGNTTATAGFIFDSQSSPGTSTLLLGGSTNTNLLVGTSTYGGGLNSLFVLNGNDVLVQGQLGSIGGLFSATGVTVGTGTTVYGDGLITQTSGDLVINAGKLTPNANNTLDLGSSTNSWRAIYASGTVRMTNGSIKSNTTDAGLVVDAPATFSSYIDFNQAGVKKSNVYWNSSNNALVISDNSVNTNVVLVGSGTGNVGVGTLSPSTKLDVQGTVSSTAMLVGGVSVCLANGTNCPASAGDITAVGSMTSGAAFADSTADDDWLGLGASAGRIEFDDQATDEVNILGAYVGIGTSTPGALLSLASTSPDIRLTGTSVADGVNSGGLFFQDASNNKWWSVTKRSSGWGSGRADSFDISYYSGSGWSDYMTVATSGKVGIGTTNPSYRLTVSSTSANDGIKILVPDGTSNNAQVVFSAGNEPQFGQGAVIQLNAPSASVDPNALLFFNRTNGPLQFASNNLERLRITSSGDVGIGTTSPSTKLDVLGVVSSTGGIFGSSTTTNATTTRLAFTSASGSSLTISGQSVCLANGTNCPSTSGFITSSTWQFNNTSNISYLTTTTQDVLMGGSATATAGFIFDSSLTGTSTLIIGGSTNTNLLVGTSTYGGGLNANFSVNGNDLFVQGQVGSIGGLYSATSVVIGSGSTFLNDGNLYKTTSGDFTFALNNTASSWRFYNGATNTLTVASSGNIGIGVAFPMEALDVFGNIRSVLASGESFRTISTSSVSSSPVAVVVQGNYAYVGTTSTLSVVDITDPLSPHVTGVISSPGAGVMDIDVQNRIAVAASHDANVVSIIDVANPSSPASAGNASISQPRSVRLQGHYVYVTTDDDKFYIVDISTPTAPSIVASSTFPVGTQPRGFAMVGTAAYIADFGTDSIRLVAISDLTNVTSVGSVLSLGAGAAPTDVAIAGRYAYVVNSGSSTLAVVDYGNPLSGSVVATAAVGSSPSHVSLNGRYAYVTNSGGGTVSVVDISIPTAPVTLGTFAVGSTPKGLDVAGRYAYVTNNGADTLSIVDIHGIETNGLVAASANIGSLQVPGSAKIDHQLIVNGGLSVDSGGAFVIGNIASTNGIIADRYVSSTRFYVGDGGTTSYGQFNLFNLFSASATSTGNSIATLTNNASNTAAVLSVSGGCDNGDAVSDLVVVGNSTDSRKFSVRCNGDVHADGSVTGGGADYAEFFKKNPSTEILPGTVISLFSGSAATGTVEIASSSTRNTIVGVVSTKPGFIGNGMENAQSNPAYVTVGLLGQIPTRVTSNNGTINVGDPLTISDRGGIAMKATSAGIIIGYAMEPYDSSGDGVITVFVKPGYFIETLTEEGTLSSGTAPLGSTSSYTSVRAGLAKIYAGATEVHVTFQSIGAYPLITVAPYGLPTGGWGITSVEDDGFTITLTSAQTFDLVFSWKIETAQTGQVMSFSDNTSALFDPTTGLPIFTVVQPTTAEPGNAESSSTPSE